MSTALRLFTLSDVAELRSLLASAPATKVKGWVNRWDSADNVDQAMKVVWILVAVAIVIGVVGFWTHLAQKKRREANARQLQALSARGGPSSLSPSSRPPNSRLPR